MSSRLQTVLALINTAAIAGVLFALVSHQQSSEAELEELRAQVRKSAASTDANLAERRAPRRRDAAWATQA
ncbi:hypothetical protein, partial [Corallococcus sp. 4LFB]|uniref:hypothetical protein n=1 Tax=Corallococcus sp. 4LFB TaxID=3383249 RepID=UPI0039754746